MTYRERLRRVRSIRETTTSCPRGFCVVAFDVPERKRHCRMVLGRLLKSCGFTRTQKSVWKSDRDVGAPFDVLLGDLGLRDWVMIIEGEFKRTN